MARADIATVENVLDAKVDVRTDFSLFSPSDLDAVAESADGPMGPARSTVLRNMLIQALGAVVGSVHVAPVEVLRKRFHSQILMWEWADGGVAPPHDPGGLG